MFDKQMFIILFSKNHAGTCVRIYFRFLIKY